MRKPNFFIVGAPKCGTTALSEYLRNHPQAFISTPKEPHYFATDIEQRSVTSLDDYLSLFAAANESHVAIGEASVWYLYSKEAIKKIRKFKPSAKLIVMVRNPADLVYSMHSQGLFNLAESELDFSKAWSLSEKRKVGAPVPKECLDRKLLYYDEIAKLGTQLENVLKYFPLDQVKVLFFEEFTSDTKRVYRDVLDFLGLKDDLRMRFQKINQNKRRRSRFVKHVTQNLPTGLVSLYLKVKTAAGIGDIGLLSKIEKWNKVNTIRQPLANSMRREVIQTYEEDILKLAGITKRDLGHWIDV